MDSASQTEVYEKLAPTPLWRVRFFVPGQKEEYWVSVDATTGAAVGFTRTLLDDAPGATVGRERALELARTFLRAHAVFPSAAELKEQTEKDERARRDHTLVWEFPVAGGGEARLRQQVVVQGDAVGSWTRAVKIPEEWRRAREKETVLTVSLNWLKFPLVVGLVALALLLLVRKLRAGEVPWRFALLAGVVASGVTLVRMGLSLDAFWARYPTSIPASAFTVVILISVFLAAVASFVAAALVAALAGALYPAAANMLGAPARRLLARDALVGGAVALGLTLAFPTVRQILRAAIPAGFMVGGVSWPVGIESKSPFLFALCDAAFGAIVLASLAAILAGVLARYVKGTTLRLLLAALFVLSFLPTTARTPAEYLVAALSLALAAGGALLLIRFFLRDNPLAWLWSAWFGLGGSAAVSYLEEPAASCRVTGALIAGVVLASAVWLTLANRGAVQAPEA